MAHNPQAPQGPEGNHDPAGSTQMFRAFVDDGAPQGAARPAAAPQQQSGPRIGVIAGVIAVIVVLAAVAFLALG